MSVVFLVSDFITDEDVFGSPELRMLASGHDVIAVVPEDPAETALPAAAAPSGFATPSRAHMSVGLNSASRQAYAEAVATSAHRRRGCVLPGIDRLRVRLDRQAVMEPLLELFARRKIA